MTRPRLLATAPAHAPVLAALHAQCFADAWGEEAIASLLALPTTTGFIAGIRPPRGFILCAAAAGEAEILTLCVAPGTRGRGLGQRLVGAAMDHLRRNGAGRLFLEVAEDNAPARALYRRLGLAEAGRRRGYYGPGRDALLLARPI